MSKQISGKIRVKAGDLIRTLERAGFSTVIGKSDGHYHMTDGKRNVNFPFRSHNRPIRQGTLGMILRRAGLTKDEFLELLK